MLLNEKIIDSYHGYYKKSVLGKKCPIKLDLYAKRIEGMAYELYSDVLSNESVSYSIDILKIHNIYEDSIEGAEGIVVEYIDESRIVSKPISKIALLGITNPVEWIHLLLITKEKLLEEKKQEDKRIKEIKEKERILAETKESEATQFYLNCINFHLKNTTPRYEIYKDKNKIALIYIDENKALNFLKIDGYNKEENNGVIPFDNIHYYEKAGDIHYVSEIHGDYSNYGGSVTGGNFSKLAAVGGGLLFGMMGMATGALLSYKPSETKGAQTNFTITSDTKEIDARSVILNFYSDIKKQYIDIELPKDIYNFFQTHLPEKKYSIVLEVEKKAVIEQTLPKIESNKLPASSITQNSQLKVEQNDSLDEFRKKVERLKIMKEAGLLSDEEFNSEKSKLLEII